MEIFSARERAAFDPKYWIASSVFMPIVKHASGPKARNQSGMLNVFAPHYMDMETFGDRLQRALDQINRERVAAGRDQVKKAHLAKACGVAPASVTQWISGQTKGMKPENLFAAADFLGIKACGVAPAAVTQWISGQTKGMKPENLFAAADFLGIEARWLATGEGPMRVNRQNLVDLSHLDPKQRAAFQALICPNGDKGTGGNHRH